MTRINSQDSDGAWVKDVRNLPQELLDNLRARLATVPGLTLGRVNIYIKLL